MTSRPDDVPPLLPTFAGNPGADYRLRRSLTRLKEHVTSDSLRRKIGDVLDGRSTLRELSNDSEFQEFTRPRAQRTFEVWSRMPQEDKDNLVAEVRAQHDVRQQRSGAARSGYASGDS